MDEKKKLSVAQEERVAKLFRGKRTPQSGGGKFAKGDVLTESDYGSFLIECKTSITPKPSYSVKKEILQKADEERREMDKDFYALAFTFGDEEDYFVLNKKAMAYLLSNLPDFD